MTQHQQADLWRWLDPWPIYFKDRKPWTVKFITMTQAKRLKNFWDHKSVKSAHRRIMEDGWLGKRHQVASLARHGRVEYRPVVLVSKGVVCDGNHTLVALIENGYKGKVLCFERVHSANKRASRAAPVRRKNAPRKRRKTRT